MTNLQITTETPRIFLTDYASYNNGTQFQFGHWVDLSQFNDADELSDYIQQHFKDADKKSPLDAYGSTREEIMITDFEGFPEAFYSESGCDYEKIFKYIELDFENLSDDEKISLWQEYSQENDYENDFYEFDDEFFNMFFESNPEGAARATFFGQVNWSDTYVKFNGYGNLETFNDPMQEIDEDELLTWLIENK